MNTLNKQQNKEKEVKNEITSLKGHFVQTFLPASIYRALHACSKEQDKTLHKLIEELITSFIEKENKKWLS